MDVACEFNQGQLGIGTLDSMDSLWLIASVGHLVENSSHLSVMGEVDHIPVQVVSVTSIVRGIVKVIDKVHQRRRCRLGHHLVTVANLLDNKYLDYTYEFKDENWLVGLGLANEVLHL